MMPAAAATPFMTSRLSIFGKKFPAGHRVLTEQAARKPVIHPFEIHNTSLCRNEIDLSGCRFD
jgi:hypothetical protein